MPYDEFPNLAARYKGCTEPPAVIQALFENPELKKLFLEVLDRHIQMLNTRLDDDRLVTVYDKVLLSATSNGRDLEDPGALTLYLEAYHGINKDDPFEDVSGTLEKELAIKALLMKVSNPSPITPVTSSSQDIGPPTTLPSYRHPKSSTKLRDLSASDLPQKPPALTHHIHFRTGSSGVIRNHETHPRFGGPPIRPQYILPKDRHGSGEGSTLDRLWSLYIDAKNDYLTAPTENGLDPDFAKKKAAKFLRDTAENTLHQLEGKSMIDAAMFDDLRATFEDAKSYVVRFSGGRKRKFDCAAMEGAQGVPRRPKTKPHVNGGKAQVQHKPSRECMGRYDVENVSEDSYGERHEERKRQKSENGGYKKADKYRPMRRSR